MSVQIINRYLKTYTVKLHWFSFVHKLIIKTRKTAKATYLNVKIHTTKNVKSSWHIRIVYTCAHAQPHITTVKAILQVYHGKAVDPSSESTS